MEKAALRILSGNREECLPHGFSGSRACPAPGVFEPGKRLFHGAESWRIRRILNGRPDPRAFLCLLHEHAQLRLEYAPSSLRSPGSSPAAPASL